MAMIVKRVSSCRVCSIHVDEIFIPEIGHIVECFVTDTACLVAVHSFAFLGEGLGVLHAEVDDFSCLAKADTLCSMPPVLMGGKISQVNSLNKWKTTVQRISMRRTTAAQYRAVIRGQLSLTYLFNTRIQATPSPTSTMMTQNSAKLLRRPLV